MVMFLRVIKNQRFLQITTYLKMRMAYSSQINEAREFKVPVPWGHVAGKEWGGPDGPKILAVHGWQDNAGTFDTLIPLLDPSLHIYAIDLPGHGHSSHIPHGLVDGFGDKISAIHRVVLHFAINHFIFLGHSLGGVLGYLYSSIFQEKVSHLICLDNLMPIIRPPDAMLKMTRKGIEGLIALDEKIKSNPPSYKYEEALAKYIEGSSNSVTLDSAKILAKRGLTKSSKGDGYYFTRDLKVKLPTISYGVSYESLLSLTDDIKCPVMFIRSDKGEVGGAPLVYFEECIDKMKKRPLPFRFEMVEGTHHVHLNSPEKVAPHINDYVNAIKSSL